MVNLATFDLNLLRVLEALLLERHVGRAAVRLRLSQPATSNALSRLRAQFKDPLFVRTRSGMVPTAKALALREPVSQALRQLRQALRPPPEFDPTSARQIFVLAASDHAQLLVLPKLMAMTSRFAGVSFRVLSLPRDFPLAELESGSVDLVLGVFDLASGDRAPRGLKRQLLASERFVLVGRANHPALTPPIALDLALPQLLVSPRGGADGLSLKAKRSRNVVLVTPHYLVAPWVLATTDLVAALPERIARRFADVFPLTVAPLEIHHVPLRVHQLWHPVRHDEPAHRWLREQVRQACS